jgi:RNA polymerase sigma-70 factor, ECF subfamily
MPSEVTRLLQDWSRGDRHAFEQLTPIVYSELRRLADCYLRRDRSGHTLQPTALVHEAYLKLIDQNQPDWRSKTHFFAFAAKVMRNLLVDHARAHRAAKRGGGAVKVPLLEALSFSVERSEDLVALDEALNRLAEFDDRKARIIEFRYFGGLTEEETAQILGISAVTVRRDTRAAELWLYRDMKSIAGPRP